LVHVLAAATAADNARHVRAICLASPLFSCGTIEWHLFVTLVATAALVLQVETEVGFGERVTVDLVPSGSSIPVTADNVQRYITAHADHLLNGAIARQFGAFQRGFLRLCSGKALHFFRWVPGLRLTRIVVLCYIVNLTLRVWVLGMKLLA
jgi:hypothetical protein